MQHPQQKTKQEILKRKGKFFLLLPVIALPFITLLLWSMGIIGQRKEVADLTKKVSLNLSLPEAQPNADSN